MYMLGYMLVCMVYVMGDVVFVGDMLFMLDGGFVWVDFFGGDVGMLYDLIQKVLFFLEGMCFYMCYDYGLNGCDIVWEIMVGEEKEYNIYVGGGKICEEFVKFWIECDVQLVMFKLIILFLQVNM